MQPRSQAAPRSAVRTLAACFAVCVLAACAGQSNSTARATVSVLWFGTTGSGETTYGVTPVEVRATRASAPATLSVDVSGASRAGEQWQTAAWTAATVGSMLAGSDPRGLTISYQLKESIDGPSAGAVLTTAVLGDLRDSTQLAKTVTMTGTVLPSGAIGPVGGIPAKLRAAADADISTVLIPQGQNIVVDAVSGRRVVASQLASELGIRVEQVASVQEAFDYFRDPAATPGSAASDPTRTPTPGTSQQPGASAAISAQLLEYFVSATNAALPRLEQPTIAAAPSADMEVDRQRIAAGVELARSRTPQLLATNREFEAFARVTLAERELQVWNTRAQTYVEATSAPLAAAAQVRTAAAALAVHADAAIDTTSVAPVSFVEQAAALPDALCWATDTWATATMVESSLGAAGASALDAGASDAATPDSGAPEAGSAGIATAAELSTLAGLLQAARYDLDVYLPFSVQVATAVGRTPITNPGETTSILAAYAQLLSDTGQATRSDAERGGAAAAISVTELLTDPLAWEATAMSTLAQRWADQSAQVAAADSPNSVAPALAAAMSYYVSAATWAATAQLAHADGASRTFSQSDWSTQVDVATSESLRSAAQAEAIGLDPSYLAWNEGFGRGVAVAADAIGANDAIRLNGLQVQWYGNVQGHMLLAMGNAQAEKSGG